MGGAEFAQQFQKTGPRQVKPGVGGNRFDDHRGDVFSFGLKKSAQRFGVVEGEGHGQLREHTGNPGTVRLSMGERSASRLYQQRIDMAVIAAFEFENLLPSRETACQADGRHGGLRAAVDHAHFFNGWHPLGDGTRHFHLKRIGNAEANALARRLHDRFPHHLGRMSQDRRPPGPYIVDIFLSFDVPDMGPQGAVDEKRLASNAPKSAYG